MEDEVLENTRWRKAEEKPKGEEVRFRSGGRSEESRSISIENGVKIVGQESFSWLRECILQRKQGMQEESTEGEEMKQQQRMEIMTVMLCYDSDIKADVQKIRHMVSVRLKNV